MISRTSYLLATASLLSSANAAPVIKRQYAGNPFTHGVSTQILTWIAVVASLLVVSFLFLWRYNKVNRWHQPTFRAIMLPVNANIPFLGIKPVPIRPYQPRQYPARTALGRLGRRRVSGADIGSGGQRAGNGDIDDLDVRSTDNLPEYKASQPGLPDYTTAWETSANTAELEAPTQGQEMLSVSDYERATRAATAGGSTQMTEMRGSRPAFPDRTTSRVSTLQRTPSNSSHTSIPPAIAAPPPALARTASMMSNRSAAPVTRVH